ncbi:transcription termination factor Rho [Rubricoccus marinus]|uniref:transcription termination factor Rho n=1 Tax=Rubricoccus marinus TaxID=716817 RepID=UPI000B99BF3F|nr:transcription termination factor Rho [Rubricoccus marinus]
MADDTQAEDGRESKVTVDQEASTSPKGKAKGNATDAETPKPKKTRSRVTTVDLTSSAKAEKPAPRSRKKADDDAPEAEKPKRAPRKKKTDPEADAAEETPKKRAPRKKAAAKDADAPEADEKPKRRSRKKAEPEASSDDAPAPEASGEADEKPKRKRTRRKVDAEPVASSDDPKVAEATGDEPESRSDDSSQGQQNDGDDRRSRGNRNDNRGGNQDQEGGGRRRNRNRNKKKGGGGGQDQNSGHPGQEFEGVLELIGDKKFGFIREFTTSLKKGDNDPFMPPPLIQKHDLRDGVKLTGIIKPGRKGAWQVTRVDSIMDGPVEDWEGTEDFEKGMVIYPEEKLNLISSPSDSSMRVVDLVTPLGKGQRALIVAPPRAGKTILLKKMAEGLAKNHPGIKMIALLIDERPEEVTDFRRNTEATVFASSNDYGEDNHVRVATLAFEYSRRMVEQGHDVVVLLDSLTRLGRTFNLFGGNSGRTMSGGLDARALLMPRKIFSSARNIENGGSLTIIATALVETGSRMDDVIFEEFKGTGNAEIVLDRELSEKRVYPAINIRRSGTRNEERLVPEEHTAQRNLLLRALNSRHPVEAMQALLKQIQLSPSNEHLLNELIPESA